MLEAARTVGVDIPAICADDRLAPSGACRLCLVMVEGQGRPVTACTTPAADGMVVVTTSAELVALRRTLLELLAGHYPAAAVATSPEEPFHRLLAAHGVTCADLPADPGLVDDSRAARRQQLSAAVV